MKILQAVASQISDAPEGRPGYELVCYSKEMPRAVRLKALGFNYPSDGDSKPSHALKTTDADGESWLLMNRIVPDDIKGHVSHTLAFRIQGMARDVLGSLLEDMRLDLTAKLQESSGENKRQAEKIVAEFRREVTTLKNRVEEYSNSKWWVFGGEDEIKRREHDIEQLERTSKKAAEDQMKEYRAKIATALRLLPDGKLPGRSGTPPEPTCFPELMEKFESLATDYREYSRIIAICNRCSAAETSVIELQVANAQVTGQLAEAKRELEVSKISDKIMSSKMKGDRKDGARLMAWNSSKMSWQTASLSLAAVVLLVLLVLEKRGDEVVDPTDAAAATVLLKYEWEMERTSLNDQIKKLKANTVSLEPKERTDETGN
jgi:hypothetical protein